MINRVQIKAASREQIRGKVWKLFQCCMLVVLVSWPAAFSPLNFQSTDSIAALPPSTLFLIFAISLILMLAQPPLFVSLKRIFIRVTDGTPTTLTDIFWGFSIFGKALWLNIISSFFITLWTLLLIVPGVIKAYAYSMAPYILADNPDMTAREALNRSKAITQGYKGDLFVLDLSFILWAFLVIFTFGIATIYVNPYVETTKANYYKALSQGSPS